MIKYAKVIVKRKLSTKSKEAETKTKTKKTRTGTKIRIINYTRIKYSLVDLFLYAVVSNEVIHIIFEILFQSEGRISIPS